LLFSGRSSLVD